MQPLRENYRAPPVIWQHSWTMLQMIAIKVAQNIASTAFFSLFLDKSSTPCAKKIPFTCEKKPRHFCDFFLLHFLQQLLLQSNGRRSIRAAVFLQPNSHVTAAGTLNQDH